MTLGNLRIDLADSLEHARARPRVAPPLAPAGVPIRVAPPAPSRRALIAGAPGSGAPPRRPLWDPLLSLVHRVTQGFQLKEYERARGLGFDAYLEEQLDPLALDDSELEARLAGFPTLAMGPKEIHDASGGDPTQPLYEIKAAAVVRSVYSKRQLLERMVEFWGDHFHLDHHKGDLLYLWKPEDDRTVIRAHALDTFPALLSASTHGAGMLFYLDNWLNRAGAIQENHARELLELHTVGPGAYTEQDVEEVAKCLTGCGRSATTRARRTTCARRSSARSTTVGRRSCSAARSPPIRPRRTCSASSTSSRRIPPRPGTSRASWSAGSSRSRPPRPSSTTSRRSTRRAGAT
jgi:hypothetical protein